MAQPGGRRGGGRSAWRPGIAAGLVCLLAGAAGAQDYQFIRLGNGFPNSECVSPGANLALDSSPSGDDVSLGGSILSGANGICESALGGDDQRPPNGVILNAGLPGAPIIRSGTPGAPDTICHDTIVPGGDDVVLVAPGNSKALQLGIIGGLNGSIQSAAGGDDVLTAIICPGGDGTFQSVANPADEFPANSDLCDVCVSSTSCIIPGTDGVLQTTASPSDVLAPVILTGADGISNSTAVGDDVQVITPGSGFDLTFCISAGADGIAQTTLCGNGIADADENGISGDAECEDGNQLAGDGCSAICQPESICGNGILNPGEECDDNNLTAGDGCDGQCRREFCGDGIVQAGLGEECDDGNNRNGDACVVGCRNAFCGDGFLQRGVEECEPPNTTVCDATCQDVPPPPACGDGILNPGEQCDDGNSSNKDNCLTICIAATCGDGFVHTKGSPPFEQCDDGNVAPGDGCSPSCTTECGNGVIDGACSQGTVGTACSTDADCDTAPGAGDGACVGETCDPGAGSLCQPGPQICSNLCHLVDCGNGEVECDEQCDLGAANGVEGSGCEADCTRNLVGRRELTGERECLLSWTLDEPPSDPTKRTQACQDGGACDFDAIAGQCTFRVGVCLNRLGISACTTGDLRALDLRLHVERPQHAAAAEAITTAVATLAASGSVVPDRCRLGIKRKSCLIPNNYECDSHFGVGDGRCDIGTGVLFLPPLEAVAQTSACTPSIDVAVAAGRRLKLPALARTGSGRRDKDTLRLVCLP
jgi:cysteine-rich repeat protein